MTDQEIQLTEKQEEFIRLVNEGKNIFLTGKAGTGKSFIVKKIISDLIALKRKVVAVAPTGVAANNIDGQTIHSMFRLTPYGVISFEECQFIRKASRDVLKEVNVIVVDEISMVRPDILDGMHWTMKKNGLDGLDQKQVIFVGDMKQLPPILDDNTKSVLYRTYDGDTFEFAQIFKKLNVVTIELDEVVRQSDPDFIEALNSIRDGGKHPYFKQFVGGEPKGIVLAPHTTTVNKYNEDGLNAQEGEILTFQASITGSAKPEDFNLENEIRVKHGCKIMYLVNSHHNPLRNGTLGTFVQNEDKYFIKVDGVEYALSQVQLTKKQYVYDRESDSLKLEELGTITQYPFKLAYALTIHKSQGLTFDECTIDLRRPCFQAGQMYVALSRVRTPQGLRIIVA